MKTLTEQEMMSLAQRASATYVNGFVAQRTQDGMRVTGVEMDPADTTRVTARVAYFCSEAAARNLAHQILQLLEQQLPPPEPPTRQ